MESYYEINVSYNGFHFFATSPRSAKNRTNAWAIFSELKERFPEKEGYKITCSRWVGSGSDVSIDELQKAVKGK